MIRKLFSIFSETFTIVSVNKTLVKIDQFTQLLI